MEYILEVKHDRICIYGNVPLCQLAAVNELARSCGFTELVECVERRFSEDWVHFEFRPPIPKEEALQIWGVPPLESSCTRFQYNQIMEDTKPLPPPAR